MPVPTRLRHAAAASVAIAALLVAGAASGGRAGAAADAAQAPVGTAPRYSLAGLIGMDIRTPEGETIGRIRDVVLTADGRAAEAVLSVGGFLGLGEKLVAESFEAITFRKDGAATVAASREDYEARPAFAYERLARLAPTLPAIGSDRAARDGYVNAWSDKVEGWTRRLRARPAPAGGGHGEDGLSREWAQVEARWNALTEAPAADWPRMTAAFESAYAAFEARWTRDGAIGAPDAAVD